MTMRSLFNRPAKAIPFKLHKYDGRVVIYYGKNNDPVKVGFGIIPHLNFDINLCRGFPVIYARVDYSGLGYRQLFGWIQIVTDEYYKSREGGEKPKSMKFIDLVPSMLKSGIPFAPFGYLPEFFDAPCYNIGNHAKLRWIADTFLTTVPMRSQKEKISCIAGFRWGYIEYDNPKESPTSLLPLQAISKDIWNGHLSLLRRQFRKWSFARSK
jgi:hypothetical protein